MGGRGRRMQSGEDDVQLGIYEGTNQTMNCNNPSNYYIYNNTMSSVRHQISIIVTFNKILMFYYS